MIDPILYHHEIAQRQQTERGAERWPWRRGRWVRTATPAEQRHR